MLVDSLLGAREGAQQRSTYRNLAVGHESDNRSSHHKTASNAAQLRVWLLAQLRDHVSPAIGCNQGAEPFRNKYEPNSEPN